MVDQPRTFLIEDVRCFSGAQEASIRPFTLLVGENSTGKTTFLGCYGVLHRFLSRAGLFGSALDFNREPFSMGSFREIVRSRLGRAGRIDRFTLGLDIEPNSRAREQPYNIKITFAEERSQPVVSSVHYRFDQMNFLNLDRINTSNKTVVECPNGKVAFDYELDESWLYFLYSLRSRETEHSNTSPTKRQVVEYVSNTMFKHLGNRKATPILDMMNRQYPRILPVAPLRSKPKRTYDPFRETESPEGEHIPMLMMRLHRTDKGKWSALHDELIAFGNASGLFSDIVVKRHGGQMSDPFQLQVKARSGSRANIMDVGYGVSQSLPILVDVRSNRNCTFLLQQPEVHLHPRAQAELAGLFVESFRKHGNRFLIETHSDYIIDRMRILVKKRLADSKDVSILYFAPQGNTVVIHNVAVDDEGNLQNVPRGYRDFFIRESDRLLGFSD